MAPTLSCHLQHHRLPREDRQHSEAEPAPSPHSLRHFQALFCWDLGRCWSWGETLASREMGLKPLVCQFALF